MTFIISRRGPASGVARQRSSAPSSPNVPRHFKPKAPVPVPKPFSARREDQSGPLANEFNQYMNKLEALLGKFAT